jgi:hypothetical protein
MGRPVADLSDRIARVVDRREKAAFGHARHQPLDGLALAPARARDRDEPADQLDVGLYASTFAVAAITRSTWAALITSGGR